MVLIVSYETQGSDMPKLIGYARVSTRQQSADRQEADLVSAGSWRDDLYVDHGVSGTRASHPQFDCALNALEHRDTLVITTLDRLGRSTQNMLAFADEFRGRGAGFRVLNLGGRPQRVTDSQVRSAIRLVESGEPAAQVARDLGLSCATF